MVTQFINRCTEKIAEMQEQVIIELIYLTGFNTHAFNLKGLVGASYAIEAIEQKGFIISEIESGDALKKTYILQRYGKTIAQRDVCMKIRIERKGDIK